MIPLQRTISASRSITEAGLRWPRLVLLGTALVTLVLAALILRVKIDTDPENMLPTDDPVRVLNRSIRDDFGTRDVIALGIVDDEGVLTTEVLSAASRLVDDIARLDGVVSGDIVSFRSAAGLPAGDLTPEDVDRIPRAVAENPLLGDRVVSPDGRALAIYIPLESKDYAHDVSSSVRGLLEDSGGLAGAEHYLAGLPLAEEAFGRDMFVQMAVLAPLAGMLIFLLMLYFFRRLSLVLAAMFVAMFSVIWVMGAMIGTGFTVHIMSSMIPVFLMPIAILDSIHILSEFFDRYPHYQDRRTTLRAVYRELFTPISYTSLTTAVAFASLALAPIPPIRVFGLFVALGVLVAWLLTMLFVPAFVMVLDEGGLKRGLAGNVEARSRLLTGGLRRMGRLATKRHYVIPAAFVLLAAVPVPGLARLEVNDNPVRWFKSGSEIRVATEELTRRFPGTYNASLIIEADQPGTLTDPRVATAVAGLAAHVEEMSVVGRITSYVDAVIWSSASRTVPDGEAGIEEALRSLEEAPEGSLVGGLITGDRRKANLQVQMKEGDNRAMERVVDRAKAYVDDHPLPAGVSMSWGGETYLNLVWQDRMVSGMLKAFLSAFGVVLLLMVLLFRSLRWALLAMLPMSATVLFVYGALGFIGKDYDMPLAVLSTLVLGIAVDFAIHFIQRYRQVARETETSRAALSQLFEEPARAITRNALVIGIGFVPMFFAALTPYVVVGTLMASIMLLSWLATLLLLPAVITSFQGRDEPAPVRTV